LSSSFHELYLLDDQKEEICEKQQRGLKQAKLSSSLLLFSCFGPVQTSKEVNGSDQTKNIEKVRKILTFSTKG
jgi:hypothetical protein